MSTHDVDYVLPKVLALTPAERCSLLHCLADAVRDCNSPRRPTSAELLRWVRLLAHRCLCYAEGSGKYAGVNDVREDLRLLLDLPSDPEEIPETAVVSSVCAAINSGRLYDRAELFAQMRKELHPQAASELALVLGQY